MPKSIAPSEADLAVNRALLAHTALQRSLANFLAPVSTIKTTNWKTASNNLAGDASGNFGDGENEEDFVAEEETAGLSMAPPTSTTHTPSSTSLISSMRNEDRFRRQLLGKRGKDARSRGRSDDRGLVASKPRPMALKPKDDSDEDEDESRSGVGRRERRRQKMHERPAAASKEDAGGKDEHTELGDGTKVTPSASAPMKKRPASYLDEILAERAAKKKKGKSKKQADDC